MVTVICSSEQICRKIISVYQYKVPLKYSAEGTLLLQVIYLVCGYKMLAGYDTRR